MDRLRPVLILANLLMVGHSVKASPPPKPTLVQESHATVSVGGEVSIVLNAVPSYRNNIEFEIFQQPFHGHLSKIKQLSDHTACVIYKCDGISNSRDDVFFFRARAPGCAKSPPSKVTLEIVPAPPLLTFNPEVLDFGKVILSEKSRRQIKIINSGGSPAQGHLELPNGFSASESNGFFLREGESVTIYLDFSPMEAREYNDHAGVAPNPMKSSLSLHGIGVPRFDLIRLNETQYLVKNLSGSSFQISCSGGGLWETTTDFTLTPYGETNLRFWPSPDATQDAESPQSTAVATLTDGLSRRDITLPPATRLIPFSIQGETPYDLGSIPPGVRKSIQFSVHNKSPFPKEIRWKAKVTSGTLEILPPKNLLLGPGESKTLFFEWKFNQPGKTEFILDIDEGSDKTKQRFVWNGIVVKPEQTPTPDPIPRLQLKNVKMVQDEYTKPNTLLHDQQYIAPKKLPPIEAAESGFHTNFLGASIPYIKWDRQEDKNTNIILEYKKPARQSFEEKKANLKNWRHPQERKYDCFPVVGYHHKKDVSYELVTIPDLQPGQHLLMLTLIADDGQPRASTDFEFFIHPTPSFLSRWKILIGLALILVLFILYKRLN